MIRIDQKRIQHGCEYGSVATVLAQCLAYVLLQISIRRLQFTIHGNTDQFFLVWRQFRRDVLEEHERAELHEEFAEQQRRGTRLAMNAGRASCLGTGVIGRFNFGYGFKYTVVLDEAGAARSAPFVPPLSHLCRLETKERVEKVIRIATQQCARQPDDLVAA